MPVVTLELATAVAEAGAFAMVSALRAPTPYLVDTLEKAASRTGAAIGVNFVIPFLKRATLKAVATRAKLVDFFGDPDAALVESVHTAAALACWHIGSVDEAIAAERAGCDLIAAQGIEAGGHVRGRLGLFPFVGHPSTNRAFTGERLIEYLPKPLSVRRHVAIRRPIEAKPKRCQEDLPEPVRAVSAKLSGLQSGPV
jgi:NAD(P)H-dependent flavin oxidoreductase YrpB (nitropropane dioxygenase family)